MIPTVSRHELESDDIVAEVGLVPMRRNEFSKDSGTDASGCEGKRRFDTFAEAHDMASRHGNLQTYRWRHCRGFHNGNRRPKA